MSRDYDAAELLQRRAKEATNAGYGWHVTDLPGANEVWAARDAAGWDAFMVATTATRLNPNPRYGYPLVGIHYRGRHQMIRVHLLVARAFLGPQEEGIEVRHLDGDPTNPRLGNLAYGTHTDNMRDMVQHGRARKAPSHCKEGHELTPGSFYEYPRSNGRGTFRRCKTCASDTAKARWARGERW